MSFPRPVSLVLAAGWVLACRAETPRSTPSESAAVPDPATSADTAAPQRTSDTLASPVAAQLDRLARQRWTFDLDSLVARRIIRVLVVPSRILYFVDGARQRGASYEAGHEFEQQLNRKLRTGALPVELVFIPVARDQLISRLAEGRGELAIGDITVTPDRRRLVDFSEPIFTGVREVVVTGPGAPPLHSVEDLAGQEVFVRASSSFAESIRRLNAEWKGRGLRPITIRPADENLEDGDILELVNAGLVPITVVDSFNAAVYAPDLSDVTVRNDLAVATGGTLAWAMRKGTPELRAAVNEFVREHRVGTTFGNVLVRRYFRENRWLHNPAKPDDQRRFDAVAPAFRKYSAEFGLDPLLLLAQGYQESGLDQRRKSHAGAVGVMQIKPSTAAGPPIGITHVERLDSNVRAGAKYLRFVIDRYFQDSAMTPLDRQVFAIAAYNAGPARIAGLRRRAAAEGLDPNRWLRNVDLIAAREIGRETVDYVGNIYKYYLAYSLLAARRDARERAESLERARGP
jgi:membrane-bound lytic murein transglycosylase MltF